MFMGTRDLRDLASPVSPGDAGLEPPGRSLPIGRSALPAAPFSLKINKKMFTAMHRANFSFCILCPVNLSAHSLAAPVFHVLHCTRSSDL